MLHQFDSSAIAQQHQQQQQQQQQSDNHHTSTGLCTSLRATTIAPSAPPGQHPRPIQESGFGFIQELYRGDHHRPLRRGQEHIQQEMTENVPLAPPSPLLLNPTILASQQPPESSTSTSRHLLQEMELHPHMVHPSLQRDYSTLEQQQFQQLHRGAQIQQEGYIMQQQQSNQQHHEQRGRTDSAETGFQRKRSLSVPLLLSIQQTGSNGAQRQAAVAQAVGQRKLQQGNGEEDQDMDMDETPSNSQANQDKDTSNLNGGDAAADYSKMNVSRESFLATIPRIYRHRVYTGASHPLYYSQHHYNLRSSIYYSPFANRKFPPYQFWANSAQRDFHLSRIGVAGAGMMGRARGGILSMSGRESDSTRVGSISPLTVMGDLMLRPAMVYSSGTGAANGGGVNKAHYRSRLPVHLRHMTSRTNRRAAICVNPFQAGADKARRDGLPASTSAATESETLPDGSFYPGPASSSSSSKSTGADRRKHPDWKMTSAQDQDRDYPVLLRNTQGYPLIKLVRQDRDMPVVPSSLSTSRLLSQHGGLANLIHTKQEVQPGSGPRSQGGSANGANNVDRLIEEMNKWSV